MSGLFLLSAVICGNAEELGVKATVTADRLTIPTGGSVTLTCVAQHFADLEYYWIRETSSKNKSLISTGAVISISVGGNYTCRGWRRDTNSLLTESDSVTIQETVSNRIDVKLQHSWSQIFTGETITLRCEIQGGEGKVWKYEWTAPNTNSPPTSSEYRISRVSVSHSGDYRCRGSSDYLLTGWSDAFRLTVSSSKPRATLTAQSSIIPAGGSVTLSCSVEGSAGWKFDWFRRDSQFSGAQKIGAGTSEHTISISEGGIYYCRGGRGDPVFFTEESSDVTVKEASFGCERSSFIVPFIIGLVSGIIVVLLLMCCYRKIKKPCCNSLTQSQSTNQSSASQQTANQNQTQVYSSLLHGDLSVYESIRGSGNTGSDEYNNVTSGFQLEGLHKRSRHDGTEESSDYNNVNPESASGP
ncbi:unnamed protein product [Oreochromis niloticus]|nr:unnamed protein product [Mustela putorius furo]